MARKLPAIGMAVVTAAALTACAGGGGSQSNAPSDGSTGWSADDDIRFIVPFPAGSGPDATARIIASGLEDELGTSVIVENIEGGSSTVGLLELAKADADGYTIGWGTASAIAIQNRLVQNPFNGLEDLTPIAQTNLVPNVMVASPDRGFDTVEDFIAAAKKNPGEITVGLGNRASGQDIQVALLEESAGIDLKPVYFDAGQMILPAVNGTVDVSVAQISPVVQYVEAGDLAYVGTVGGAAPDGIDAESFDDAGYDTSLFQGWEGVFGPAGMDEDAAVAISAAIEKVMQSDDYLDFAATVYAVPSYLDPEEFAEAAQNTADAGPDIIAKLDLEG